jgi:L-ascorbate metabolism protein UlaG (beta-lactamase superfamily)
MLIPAKTKDDALLQEIAQHRSDGNHFNLWWLGQSGYLLQWKGKQVLIDPYLSDSLTKKYALTDKPHIRMSERVIDPQRLTNIDLVTSSHNHTDHLDAETLLPVLKNNPKAQLLIPEANRAFVPERLHSDFDFPVGINDGQSVDLAGFHIHGIPAAHNEVERDAQGRCLYMGYVFQFGEWTIYHSGDTLLFKELPDLLAPFSIDLALLPINGNRPERRVAGNLDAGEAAALAKQIGARMLIPCHYNMFAFNTADPNELASAASALHQPYRILEHGERFSWEREMNQ